MIAVVAHDAGGAEVVSSYVRRNGLACGYALAGPARDIFARKLGNVDLQPVETLIPSCDWVLCGTSFPSDLEWQAIGLARRAGKRSIAMLDHWVNYRPRFVRNGHPHLPDEVWAGDEISARIAGEELPEVACRLVPNPYFADIRRELAALPAPKRAAGAGARVLFTSMPLRRGARQGEGEPDPRGCTEEDAVRYFLSHVNCLGEEIDRITIRPHPREEPGKYAWAETAFDLPVSTDGRRSLVEQVAESDIVAGCATMAMVVGLLAGKRVISCIPPGGRTEPLPHPEIERLQDLIEPCRSLGVETR